VSLRTQVELWTQPQHHVTSSVKKGTRNPKWKNQRLEVLVQEPDSQQLRVVLQDIDMLNFKVSFKCYRCVLLTRRSRGIPPKD
jgi:hypothetical protein